MKSDRDSSPPELHILGVRHHGPGSARSVRRALERLKPDAVLVEGPPDAADVLPLVAHEQMRPPVALLIYAPDAPRNAVFYPFAVFSPEWQALTYALTNGVPVRFMDLPLRHQLRDLVQASGDSGEQETGDDEITVVEAHDARPESPGPHFSYPALRSDPIGALAAAAGYSDGERWWEHMVEQRRDDAGLFAGILEAMTALREAAAHEPLAPPMQRREALREAWMRRTIRQAMQGGARRIAVVCGAWHGPALVDLSGEADDERLLADLPTFDVRATWAPWTYGRLASRSGYGAGVESPGWYEHLWHTSAASLSSSETAARWMTRIARLLREEDLDASSAHAIEAVRLAEALAALRDRPLPGLPELTEAAEAIFCFGSDLPLRLINERLVIGVALGTVPGETPLAPLQRDLAQEQKRLRLPAEAAWREYDLDLRKPADLDRSRLLHRLTLLGVAWGQLQRSGGGKGTFHEVWRLEWQPELAVALIEAGIWGNTIADAATACACDAADRAVELPVLTGLLNQALLADLPDAVTHLMARIEREAAVANDIAHLMGALPPLAGVLRYGNVRKTDAGAVAHVVDGLVARIAIGLPVACAGLNDEAALTMYRLIIDAGGAIGLLQRADHQAAWHDALRRIADMRGGHGLVMGRATRMLLDAGVFDAAEVARRLGLALSRAGDPAQAAAWVEGLLRDSGTLLVHDDSLWHIINNWVMTLSAETFIAVLPLLRRTFATFAAPERRALGERARRGDAGSRPGDMHPTAGAFDEQRAALALQVVTQLLGIARSDHAEA